MQASVNLVTHRVLSISLEERESAYTVATQSYDGVTCKVHVIVKYKVKAEKAYKAVRQTGKADKQMVGYFTCMMFCFVPRAFFDVPVVC